MLSIFGHLVEADTDISWICLSPVCLVPFGTVLVKASFNSNSVASEIRCSWQLCSSLTLSSSGSSSSHTSTSLGSNTACLSEPWSHQRVRWSGKGTSQALESGGGVRRALRACGGSDWSLAVFHALTVEVVTGKVYGLSAVSQAQSR